MHPRTGQVQRGDCHASDRTGRRVRRPAAPVLRRIVILGVVAALVAAGLTVSAQSGAPDTPNQPTGTVVFDGGVDLEWNDVPGAHSYEVQLFTDGQWTDLPAGDIEVAFYGAGAIVSGLDPAATLFLRVRARNGQGASDWSAYAQIASTSQYAQGRMPRPDNEPATGAPAVNGTTEVGATLTADTGAIEDGNGLDRVVFLIQWISSSGGTDTAIPDATEPTYTLVAGDEGKAIKVRVDFIDRGGYSESLTSAATASVTSAEEGSSGGETPQNSPATGAPTISGTARVGETLTADTSGIADSDGLTNVSYSYQWIANDDNSDSSITDATGSSYTLVAADQGKTIKVHVSFTDDAGNAESLTSASTSSVAARPNSQATGAPTISGTARVGETLTADTSGIADSDGLTNVSYSNQWIANDGNSDSSITDATDSSYTLLAADEGKTIKVRVDFTDDAGNAETLTSAATGTVENADVPPRVSVTAGAAATEGAEATFTLTMSRASSVDVTMQVSTSAPDSGHEATADDDYTPLVDHAVVIAAGDTTETFTVSTLDDSHDEHREAFTVTIKSADTNLATVSATAGYATGTINDDDDPPVASVADVSVAEDVASGEAQIIVTLSQMSGKDISIGYSAVAGGASVDWHPVPDGVDPAWVGTDFTKPEPGSRVAIPAGDTTATITVAIIDDDIDEIFESFTVELFSPTNATVDSGASAAEVIINDDDDAPVVSVTAGAAVTEGTDATFTLTMSRPSSVNVTVQVSTSAPESGHEATPGDDYAPLVDHSVLIPALSTTETFIVSTLDDSHDEPESETFEVTLEIPRSHPDKYPDYYRASVSATAGSATGTINDNDAADLSSLTVNGVSVPGFSAGIREYQFGVDASVAQATVLGVADGAASVAYSGTDADSVTDGHQVDLNVGRNVVTVTVTDDDGNNTTRDYTVSINRGSDAPFGWSAGNDFDTLASAENGSVTGLWSDGTTMWVADDTDGLERIYAYTLATKQRDPAKDIDVRRSAEDTNVRNIWSDGTTMWAVDEFASKLFAYTLADGQRDPAKDFNTDTASGNTNPDGIWSDGVTMWLSDSTGTNLYAYTLATRQRDPSKDIDTLYGAPIGLWSDGVTMWVTNPWGGEILAYTIATKQRDPDRDFDTLSGHGHTLPWAIWSDGTTMWVSGGPHDKLWAYNMPGNANLSALNLSAGTLTPAFASGVRSYTVLVGNSVSQVTVTAQEADAGNATVVFLDGNDAVIPDADDHADGQQVDLALGDNTIKVKVTASDLVTTRVYTLTVHRAVPVSVSFGAPSYTVGEGNSTTVTVSLDQAPGREVVVPLTAVDGSGVTSADYSGVPSMVTFAASAASASFDFDAGDDNVVEGDEAVTVMFGSLPDGVTADPNAATVVTIADDDNASWAVSVGSESIAEEGETSTAVTVSTGGVTFTEAKTVTLVLAGTATEVADYTVTAKTLTLAAGEASANATVTAVDDTDIDSGESIEVTAMLDGAVIGVPQTITIADNDGENTAPVFSPPSVTRQVAENSAPGTAVGSPITATDADLHTLTYTLGGTDAASFTIVAASGQIQTRTSVVYDHEGATNTFSVTVTADDDHGGVATASVAIDIADVNEPPDSPAAPTVSAVSGSGTSLEVIWTAPDTTQKPDITGYGVQYRETGDTSWTAWNPSTVATTTTITGLTAETDYEVQVNAANHEGTSDWSTSGTGSTGTAESGCSPVFDPVPTAVEVTAVPIVVNSNTDEYFVLYVKHQENGTEVQTPVAVIRGEASTTTLAENVAALPAERYRVEKYLIADPADVDGDCIDDLTELDDLGTKSPVNPAPAIDLVNGATAVRDRHTFETLSYLEQYLKFVLLGMDTDSPTLFFINSKTHLRHPIALFLEAIDQLEAELPWAVPGEIVYDPALLAPDGSNGVYYWWLNRYDSRYSADLLGRIHTMLAAGMPLLENNLALHIPNYRLASYQSELTLLRESRIPLVFDEDIHAGSSFLPMNPGVGYGWLRVMEQGERPDPRDIAIYEALPNELPRVAGILTTVPQTPLSHVNLRAVQDAVPNAYIQDALDDDTIDDLLDSFVRYEVTEGGWSLRSASREEVDAHYAAQRPATVQVPQRDLSVTAITPLSDIGFEDWDAFGVKAANVAELAKLGFPDGTVPDGFAIPFYFYDRFMNEAVLGEESVFGKGSAPGEEKITLPAGTKLSEVVTEILAHPEFQADFDIQDEMLDDLRDAIEDAETPQWIIDAIVAMNTEFDSKFPGGQNRRYRSSTNNEDLPGFSGAGLYDSKSQKPSEDEEDLAKSLKEVYASLWNLRAFVERDFHRIDHQSAAMGILVHPSYQNELANGVAVSFDPIRGYDGFYYLNTQLGEDLVTNPDAFSEPEEILLHPSGNQYEILATSNQVDPGELLLDDAQLRQLGGHLEVIHDHFKSLYDPAPDDPFAIEIEYKITSSDILAIKQARPWVFSPPPNQAATGQPTITGTAQVGETLSADTSGIGDANGLNNVQFNYQWIRNDGNSDTNIPGATGQTYTLTDDDEGTAISVQVSFTDDHGYSETLTSTATDTVSANTIETLWSGTMTVANYGNGSLGAYLDDTRFSSVTTSIQLQIKWLWYLESERKLYLAFRAPAAGTGNWQLHIDDTALDFPSGDSNFVFRNVNVSWTEGQTVNVNIVRQELP